MSQPSSETWTIGRLLSWTADYLKTHGAASPRLDAEVLLAMAAGCSRIDLYTRFDEPAPDALRTGFRELVKRRAEGTPVAYLVGRREFYSLPFRVTPDVLIPRPETEFLVVALLDRLRPRAAAGPVSVVDVGTGSGVIAICAAKYVPGARVTAIDVSSAALAVARENAEALKVAERIEWVEGDLLAGVPAKGRFDFVVSNPPYVSEAEWESLARDVKQFEPRGALVAGPQGTEVIERLAAQARERLNPAGMLLIEISPMLEQPVRTLLEAGGCWQLEPTIKDLAGHARVVVAKAAS
ncbi:MAG TPA: peptide chain release factor N(5)-glutamine methyltransferase [Pirellulales bacterium]|nr:peptide chain release factor N(5)-glutamine methyltransferase [Pirellulales bacterium]